MPVISSRSTLLFYRYLALLLLWFLFIAVSMMIQSVAQGERSFWLLTTLVILAIVVSVIYIWRAPRFLQPFADEVQDAGDALIVRKSGDEISIAFADIAGMETRLMGRDQIYYVLNLRVPCSLGSEVAFFPINNGARFLDGTPWRSRRESIYDDLVQRITQACRKL